MTRDYKDKIVHFTVISEEKGDIDIKMLKMIYYN